MPSNFDKLPKAQQERLTKGQPFAAQRLAEVMRLPDCLEPIISDYMVA